MADVGISFHEGRVIHNNVEMPIYYSIQNKRNTKMERMHYHSYVELLYILAGGSYVRVNGVDYTVNEGDLIIINSYEEHETCCINSLSNELVVKFEPDTLSMSAGYAYNVKYILPVMFGNSKRNRIFRRAEIENSYIPDALKNGVKECIEGEFGFEFAMKAEMLRVFLWIIRKWKRDGELSYAIEKNIDILEPALRYAQSEFRYADVETAAKSCNLSYAYFSKLFKKTLGQSFTSYINNIRISESKKMLIKSNYSITDIAAELGFSTTSYFIQLFREVTGETPKSFRNHMKPD